MERDVSIARRTLQKARFFLGLAERAGIADWNAFVYCFEAAIVSGRSSMHHLHRQYVKSDRAWCKKAKHLLESEPLVDFFVKTRNFILKEGEVGIRRTYEVTPGTGGLVLSGSARVVFISGLPWYKRSLRTLWKDSVRRVLRPWREWREARREKQRIETLRREAQASTGTPPATKVQFYFASENPAAKDKPAVELAYEYLRRIETEIDTFEGRFGQS